MFFRELAMETPTLTGAATAIDEANNTASADEITFFISVSPICERFQVLTQTFLLHVLRVKSN